MADFAKAAFVHGMEQASLVLTIIIVVSAIILAPGRPAEATSHTTPASIRVIAYGNRSPSADTRAKFTRFRSDGNRAFVDEVAPSKMQRLVKAIADLFGETD